jgi:hypothetical protein
MGNATDKIWLCARVFLQFLATIPACFWFLLTAYAVPGYAARGFYKEPLLALLGCLICCLFLRSLWKRGREVRELFKIHIDFDDWIDADEEFVNGPLMCMPQQVSKRALDFHKSELKLAFLLTFVLYSFSFVLQYTELYVLRPAELEAHKAGTKCGCITPHVNANGLDACDEWSELGASCRPCDVLEDDPECSPVPEMGVGIYECPHYVNQENAYGNNACQKLKDSSDDRCFETCCPSDPNCKKWTDKMNDEHMLVWLCPTVHEGTHGYSTFSCHADYQWMQLVGVLAIIYDITLLFRTLCLPQSKKKEVKAALPVVQHVMGLSAGEEEKPITESKSEVAA